MMQMFRSFNNTNSCHAKFSMELISKSPALIARYILFFSKMETLKMNGTSVRIVKGTVTEIDISGFGPNSAQLEFAITSEKNETFVVNFDAEPQFFASATTMLLMAYQTKTPIQISIPMDQQHPGETLKINGVKLPA